jgi:hypothetical protein
MGAGSRRWDSVLDKEVRVNMRVPVRWLAVGVAGLLLASCSGSTPAIPTAEELEGAMLVGGDYQGAWSVAGPAEGALDLCDEASAESQAAAENLQWKASRHLDLAAEDPIEPPDDREGHLVGVQEFLDSGDPDQIEATFGLLREGMQACLGDFPADEEGPATAEEMTIPDVGDDRYGVLVLMEEAGGWAEWRMHAALVRRGPVLMLLNVLDIRAGEGVEPYFTVEELGGMLESAVDKLP